MAQSWKESKVQFVSHLNGSCIFSINAASVTALTSYFLWASCPARWRALLLTQFLTLVVPLLLAVTIANDRLVAFNVVVTALAALIRTIMRQVAQDPPLSPLSPPYEQSGGADAAQTRIEEPVGKGSKWERGWITVYRSHMMLMTVICILAVDFPVFPRSLAKTETWGTSLMDLGVGSFIFSLGMISALPILRGLDPTEPRPVTDSSFVVDLKKCLRKTAPIVALGVVRLIMVKGVDYPEHLSEYGVHWNFFFTLALLAPFGLLLSQGFKTLFPTTPVDWNALGLAVSIVQQMAFAWFGLQSWALQDDRTGFLRANKEGLVSLPGYVAIYALGLSSGLYLFPPEPYFYRRSVPAFASSARYDSLAASDVLAEQKEKWQEDKLWKDKPGKTANVLIGWTALYWSLFYLAQYFIGSGVSRRLANLPYVLWIAAFNTSFLLAYFTIIQLWPVAVSTGPRRVEADVKRGKTPTRTTKLPAPVPPLLEAMNRHALLVFLVANLLTGLVNVSISSIHTSTLPALLVLSGYLFAVSGSAWAMRRAKRIRI